MTEPSFISAEEEVSQAPRQAPQAPQDPNADDVGEIREKLISLSEKGEITQKEKTLKTASAGEILKIFARYKIKKLNKVNEIIAMSLVTKFSQLMSRAGLVKSSEECDERLKENPLLVDNIKDLVSCVTPYLPMAGIVIGGVTLCELIVENKLSEEITVEEQEV